MAEISIKPYEWHHLAVTWDSVAYTVKLYLDGTLLVSYSGVSNFFPEMFQVDINEIGIGGGVGGQGINDVGNGGKNVNAEIDEVTIWDVVLSATDVADLAGTFSGSVSNPASPSYQSAAGSVAFQRLPSNVLVHLPFDSAALFPDQVYSGENYDAYLTGDGEKNIALRGGLSIDFKAIIRDIPDTTHVVIDVDPNMDYDSDLDSDNTASFAHNVMKMVYPFVGAEHHNLAFVSSWADFDQGSTGSNNSIKLTVGAFTGSAPVYTDDYAYIQKNLIADGDMEMAGVGFWSAFGGATLSKSTSVYKGGRQSLKIDDGQSSAGAEQLFKGGSETTIPASHSDKVDYVFFFSAYYTEPTIFRGLCFFYNGSNQQGIYIGSNYDEYGQFVSAGAGYNTWRDFVFVQPESSIVSIPNSLRMYGPFDSASSGRDIYYDNVSAYQSEVRNGKFASDGDRWTLLLGFSKTTDTTTMHSGGFGGKLVSLTYSGAFVYQQIARLGSRSNRNYLAVAYFRNERGLDRTISLEIRDASGNVLATTSKSIPDDNLYYKLSLVFTSVAGAYNSIYLGFLDDGTMYVDDVYILPLYTVPITVEPIDEPSLVTPTEDRQGIDFYPNQQGLEMGTIVLNPDEVGFLVRFQPHFGDAVVSPDNPIIFEWKANTSNLIQLTFANGAFTVTYTASGNTYTLTESSGTTITYGDTVEVSCWFDTDGKSVDGVTYYGKLFVNGVQKASRTSSISSMNDWTGNLTVGCSSDGLNAANSVIDQLYLFVESPNDYELKQYNSEREPLHNDNAAFTVTQSIPAGSHIRLDFLNQTFEYYNSSDASVSAIGATTGAPITIKPINSKKGWIVLSQETHEVILVYRKQWL